MHIDHITAKIEQTNRPTPTGQPYPHPIYGLASGADIRLMRALLYPIPARKCLRDRRRYRKTHPRPSL